MIEKALKGNRSYWIWIAFLITVIGIGLSAYSQQRWFGLTVTGMGRDISWGLYIAQFTFLVGVAASAVMVVLPYYLHNRKEFAKTVIIGEFMAVSATMMSMLFIMADMGRPDRLLNIMLYPSPHAMVFWDLLVLSGYLFMNLVSSWAMLGAERKGVLPPAWVKPLVYISIPWAFSVHTVTAFLYAGMPGRHLWLTAVLAPRFLASAFAAGTALLILVSLILKQTTGFDTGKDAREKLAVLATYAGVANLFLLGTEFFTAFYSNVPAHKESLQYLFFGLEGKSQFVPLMWFSLLSGVASIIVLLVPALRKSTKWLVVACSALVLSIWIDKGVGLILGGFIPSPLQEIVEYTPTATEIFITLGIWGIGILLLTILLKVVVAVKMENEQ